MGKVYSDLENLLTFASDVKGDPFVRKNLQGSFDKYVQNRKESLCKVQILVDAMEYPTIYQPLDFFNDISEMRLHFVEPDTKKKWDFNRPTLELMMKGEGSGGSISFDYDPERFDNWENPSSLIREKVMYSIFVTHGYRPAKKEGADKVDVPDTAIRSRHHSIRTLWHCIREGEVIPFSLRVCAYTKVDRRIYDIDLIGNRMFPDFRNGKITVKNVRAPSALHSMYFDRLLALMEVPPLNKRVFSLLFHSNGMAPQDVAMALGINHKIALNNLKSLDNRGAIKLADSSSNFYEAAVENFKEMADSLSF